MDSPSPSLSFIPPFSHSWDSFNHRVLHLHACVHIFCSIFTLLPSFPATFPFSLIPTLPRWKSFYQVYNWQIFSFSVWLDFSFFKSCFYWGAEVFKVLVLGSIRQAWGQYFSNVSVEINHRQGLLMQIDGPHSQSVWLPDLALGMGNEHLHFWQFSHETEAAFTETNSGLVQGFTTLILPTFFIW
jgi:hypothetical protein